SAIAELVKADGPVERQQGDAAWRGAPVGTEFFLSDAARTADGGAQLRLARTAQIAMQQHTVLRFGTKGNSTKLAVDLGAIDLSGAAGNYALDVGEVKLAQNGAIRIPAKGEHASSIELLVGAATVTSNGEVVELQVGRVIELGIGKITVRPAAP